LHASEKNFDEVVVTHPSSADDPFTAYERWELSSDTHARALVANGAILAEETFADDLGIGRNRWTPTSSTTPGNEGRIVDISAESTAIES
jgi:hypothetical protein